MIGDRTAEKMAWLGRRLGSVAWLAEQRLGQAGGSGRWRKRLWTPWTAARGGSSLVEAEVGAPGLGSWRRKAEKVEEALASSVRASGWRVGAAEELHAGETRLPNSGEQSLARESEIEGEKGR